MARLGIEPCGHDRPVSGNTLLPGAAKPEIIHSSRGNVTAPELIQLLVSKRPPTCSVNGLGEQQPQLRAVQRIHPAPAIFADDQLGSIAVGLPEDHRDTRLQPHNSPSPLPPVRAKAGRARVLLTIGNRFYERK